MRSFIPTILAGLFVLAFAAPAWAQPEEQPAEEPAEIIAVNPYGEEITLFRGKALATLVPGTGLLLSALPPLAFMLADPKAYWPLGIVGGVQLGIAVPLLALANPWTQLARSFDTPMIRGQVEGKIKASSGLGAIAAGAILLADSVRVGPESGTQRFGTPLFFGATIVGAGITLLIVGLHQKMRARQAALVLRRYPFVLSKNP